MIHMNAFRSLSCLFFDNSGKKSTLHKNNSIKDKEEFESTVLTYRDSARLDILSAGKEDFKLNIPVEYEKSDVVKTFYNLFDPLYLSPSNKIWKYPAVGPYGNCLFEQETFRYLKDTTQTCSMTLVT